MILNLPLDNLLVRAATMLAALALCLGLGTLARARYVINTLSDQGVKASPAALAEAVRRFPDSARLQAQLATLTLTHALDFEASLELAENAATRAVNLAPHNVNYRLTLAAVQSVNGELALQEEHLRAAVALAPHYPQVRWQLANLLVREGKLEPSLAEFRQAVTVSPALLPSALDLLWEFSGGDLNALNQVTGEALKNRFSLAQFLLQQGRVPEAAQVFSRIDLSAKLAAPEAAEFLNKLLVEGQPEWSRRLWLEMRGQRAAAPPLVWNGGFESERLTGLTQFDWQLKRSEYANASIDQNVAHTGARALRLDFAGRDTTRLADEIKQLVVLRPGARYRLECYVKTARLVTTEGPRLAVINHATSQTVAATNAISAEAATWQPLAVDFIAPADQKLYWLAALRTPKFSYDEPTKGTIWFDDCALAEVK